VVDPFMKSLGRLGQTALLGRLWFAEGGTLYDLVNEAAESVVVFGDVLDEKLRGLRSLGERLVEAAAVSIELIQEREDVAPFFSEEGLGLTAQLTANAAAMRGQLARQLESESCSDHIEGRLRNEVSPDEAADWLTRTIFSFSVLPSEPRSGAAFRKYLRKMLIPCLIEG